LAAGWFRRIGRGLHHCSKASYIQCSSCIHGFGNTRAYFFAKNTALSVANNTNTCIEIGNSPTDPYSNYYEDDDNLFYLEDELVDDDISIETNTKKKEENVDDPNFLRRRILLSSWPTRYCNYSTGENSGVWYNAKDQVGTIMSFSVWVLVGYSAWTMMLLGQNQHVATAAVAAYWTVCSLALASHAKTTLTDPGSIPRHAVPPSSISNSLGKYHSLCSTCQAYKPRTAHHCRICNRCISRMDHHCPWMNNCVGGNNLKFFILFLLYTWIGCAMALIIFAINYFGCTSVSCEFNVIEVQLVRLMTLLCTCTILFVSSMILNVMYGIMTGVGTIDRMQKKALRTWSNADEEPVPLRDIFGIDSYFWWLIPCDPTFPDFERIMGYSTRQRQKRLMSKHSKRERDAHEEYSVDDSFLGDFPTRLIMNATIRSVERRESLVNMGVNEATGLQAYALQHPSQQQQQHLLPSAQNMQSSKMLPLPSEYNLINVEHTTGNFIQSQQDVDGSLLMNRVRKEQNCYNSRAAVSLGMLTINTTASSSKISPSEI
jgi:DHHC palmitoyltransferase